MEGKTRRIFELLALSDPLENKSISVFDQNDNNLCAKGKINITEEDAANLRACISSSWNKPARLNVGKCRFVCFKVSNVLLGTGGISCSENDAANENVTDKLKAKNHEHTNEETKVLSAMVIDGLIVILIGNTNNGESLLGLMKQIAKLLKDTDSSC